VASKRKVPGDRWSTVVVPLAVALLALVGVIAGAIISSRGGGGASTSTTTSLAISAAPGSPNETPKVELLGFAIQNVPPPPTVELLFSGNVAGLASDDQILVLGKLPEPTGSSVNAPDDAGASTVKSPARYGTSPAAVRETSGAWHVRWRVQSATEYTSYTAVVVPEVLEGEGIGCPGGFECMPDVPEPYPIELLIAHGQDAFGVLAVSRAVTR
jgi:hypothetical protein